MVLNNMCTLVSPPPYKWNMGGGGTIEISVKYFIWNMKFPPPTYISPVAADVGGGRSRNISYKIFANIDMYE